MPNSPDALLRENEAEVPDGIPGPETNAAYQARTSTTILDLRRLYGLHFALAPATTKPSVIFLPTPASTPSTSTLSATTKSGSPQKKLNLLDPNAQPLLPSNSATLSPFPVPSTLESNPPRAAGTAYRPV
jgi:hypothetical protein